MDEKVRSAKEFLKLQEGKLNSFMGVPLAEFTYEELRKICAIVNDHGGAQSNPMQPRDPYLREGWPCEVWDYEDNKQLSYYSGTDEDGHRFTRVKNTGHTRFYGGRYYRPIGTEWDFAPEYCKILIISSGGWCHFFNVTGSRQMIALSTVLPPEYYGQTIERPRWAGGGD